MKALLLSLLLIILLPFSACAEEAAAPLTAEFYAVGKADAALVTLPDGTRIMIDAGTNKNGKALAERFGQEGIERIDLLVITHFDKDHVGGADKIMEACEVSQVLMPGYAKESKQHTQFMEALQDSPQTKATTLAAKETLSFTFRDVQVTVTAAHETYYGRDEENDFSLALRLTYGDTRFFFTGDAEAPRQRELLDEGDCACDVLKVPYHGRAVSASADFLSACRPAICWVPDSQEHPADPALLQYLKETLHAAVYRSADGEGLTVLSDGTRCWVEESEEEQP